MLALAAAALAGCAEARTAAVHASDTQQCSQPYPAQRDPANPLHLSRAPGANPLTGARFFVPGPAKGSAARAIAQLVGLNPDRMDVSESWASFSRRLAFGPLHNKLVANPNLGRQVALLAKIAGQPEAQRISSYSWGGSPDGIFKQTQKVLCQNVTADPGTIPILNTYFLHATLGGTPTPAQMASYGPLFRARVDAMAEAIDRRPAVLLLEIDGIGSIGGVAKMGSLPQWEADLRYEVNTMAALPHTVVYVEGGYSDSNSVRYTAGVLNAIGVNRIRGFFTNDTHEAWTIDEVRWATKVAKRTHGAHFIVDTADNGRGPLLNRVKVGNGIEDLCNPPKRGLGPPDTTNTGYAYADSWMWTHPPGNSSGCGGGPPGGVFWPARAEGEAARANAQLGPGLPSHPF
ncbi:MAG TPA: glycoside hydrolase family 6 protein [Solirubrobacteraceae bacterium]|nr:glycoside hydrolase family 6 protein [Solirubrobacteraceae bacterium]